MSDLDGYFRSIGHPIPGSTNPAEFLLDVVSSDFGNAKGVAQERVQAIQQRWTDSEEETNIARRVADRTRVIEKNGDKVDMEDIARPGSIRITAALLHRSFIKSYRDVVAYGIRIVMYLGMFPARLSETKWEILIKLTSGLAIMMGTVWLRLHPSQESIQPFVNAIVRIQ